MEAEIWKDIPGYEHRYQISSTGNIRSIIGGRIKCRKLYKDKDGYMVVIIYISGKRKYISIHRLVAQTFIPNPDNKPQVNHINGIKNDNRLENLEWCTGSENILHSYRVLGHKSNFQTNNPSKRKLLK